MFMAPSTRMMGAGDASAPAALVVISESADVFHDVAGRRLTAALRHLGWRVRLTSPEGYDGEEADITFLVGISEPFHPREVPGDRSVVLDAETCPVYRHLFYGLTESEKRAVRAGAFEDDRRVIPWVFVGPKTPDRCELARLLIERVDPGGLLYLTAVPPIDDDGPHFKDTAFQEALRRCRFHLWRTRHSSYYMEGERFRRSALAGCVPIKVIEEDLPGDRHPPFPYLDVRLDELAERLAPGAFRELRSAFLEEYRRLPSLEEELGRFIASLRGDRVASPTRGAA